MINLFFGCELVTKKVKYVCKSASASWLAFKVFLKAASISGSYIVMLTAFIKDSYVVIECIELFAWG